MLNEPGLEYLHLCKGGQWKLREWLQQNYSGWAKQHGVREAHTHPKKDTDNSDDNILNDNNLIQMSADPLGSEETEIQEGEDLLDATDAQDQNSDQAVDTSKVLSTSREALCTPICYLHLPY